MIVTGEQRRHLVVHIHVPTLLQTSLPSRLPHNIEQSSLCYPEGSCWLFILNIAVWTCYHKPRSTNFSEKVQLPHYLPEETLVLFQEPHTCVCECMCVHVCVCFILLCWQDINSSVNHKQCLQLFLLMAKWSKRGVEDRKTSLAINYVASIT